MILGYLIFLDTGMLIKHKFNINKQLKDISLVTNGLAAIISFFREVVNSEIERVISKNHQFAIARSGNIIVAIFSDLNDAMALGLARKYARLIGSKFKSEGLKSDTINPNTINITIKDLIEELEKEIDNLNKKANELKYI